MPPLDLITLAAGGESATVEFKTSLADSRRIIETMAAMATIGGGVVLVGVRDNGRIVGTSPGDGEVERVVQQTLAATDPKVFPEVVWLQADGHRVLVLRVAPGDGPHLAFGRAFLRVGPATVAMSRDEYERRLLDRLRESSGYERREEPSRSLADVDDAAIARFRERSAPRLRDGAGSSATTELLEKLHLLVGPRLCVAGALLFGRDPQGPFPSAVIRARATRGAHEDAMACEGTLDEQIEAAVVFVARNLRMRPVRTETARREIAELPAAAVREVVANAIAHREYRSTAPVQLVLDDAGLSVWNPGSLAPPLTPASLRESHPSIPPNPRIARVLYLSGYIEEWGTGTLRVISAMAAAGNPPPQFNTTGNDGFRAVLPIGTGSLSGLPPRIQNTLQGFAVGAAFAASEYAAKAGVSQRTATLDLGHCEDAGQVSRVGVGRSTRWLRL